MHDSDAVRLRRAATLDKTVALLAVRPDDAKILAGGHSLISAMK